MLHLLRRDSHLAHAEMWAGSRLIEAVLLLAMSANVEQQVRRNLSDDASKRLDAVVSMIDPWELMRSGGKTAEKPADADDARLTQERLVMLDVLGEDGGMDIEELRTAIAGVRDAVRELRNHADTAV